MEAGAPLVDSWTLSLSHVAWVHLFKHDFHQCGDAWYREQNLKEFGFDANGVPLQSSSSDMPASRQREYRLAIAYKGEAEQRFLEETQEIMENASYWAVLPGKFRTARWRTRATITLTKGATDIYCIKSGNTNYPNKAVAARFDDNLRKQVEEDFKCSCRMDVGTRQILRFYGGVLTSAAARADLLCIAIMALRNNVQIEYRNQRTRRFVLNRSIQCRLVELQSLQVFWLFDMMEQIMRSWWKLAERPCAKKSTAAASSQVPADKDQEDEAAAGAKEKKPPYESVQPLRERPVAKDRCG